MTTSMKLWTTTSSGERAPSLRERRALPRRGTGLRGAFRKDPWGARRSALAASAFGPYKPNASIDR
jgi:hypothetical protein